MRPLPTLLIGQIDPEPSGSGAAEPRAEQWYRRIVGMDHRRRFHMGTDHGCQRRQPPGGMSYPISQRGTFNGNRDAL